ncbi:MAG TPA: imidazole glycerol phosphate synthase subunit HisH [Salinivirgaceae bacterium]|nr:imidazole glycerol phosphate synthase subunit HisH [Salinivirgaceae bacterium]
MKLVIVDYGMGNLFSVYKSFNRLKVDVRASQEKDVIASADKLILPGVGNFGMAMKNLQRLNLQDVLNEFVLVKKRPVLGICLGMQLMTQYSEEGDSEGLGWFDAKVVRFRINNPQKFRVPHMGWNSIRVAKESPLLKGIDSESEFYFVHSYHTVVSNTDDVLCTTVYESEFCSAIAKENIFGVQFHPEKSHDAGIQLLKNFITL